ncbi:phage portal protein [Anaerotignum sp.]|uniref:phage portal protein n=1 Tax=Anaerotignum sp. TaxID=2039241 RepID=UPI002899648C|nr:phage portal protein [Anaerotignum sp.]
MAISMKRWLVNKLGLNDNSRDVAYVEICAALEEYRIRELAFNTCVSMIANAIGRCEFKTYDANIEIRGAEYYTWNVEPNLNQNSTAFLHKLVYRLYNDNEALIISIKHRDGREMLVVADSYEHPLEFPQKMQEYKGVVVGEFHYEKTFKESEVIHLRLNHVNIKPVLDGLYQSYIALVQAAMKNYSWENGKHYKVHIGQIAQGDDDWEKNFKGMLETQVKPFLEKDNGVLPEFDGYEYVDVGSAGGKNSSHRNTRDIRALVDDIFAFTARGFSIPPVLPLGDVADTKDAMQRWLTTCIDPLCDQLQEEINRKRYGFERWRYGDFIQIDTSSIMHFDIFGNASNIEKLVGSGAFSINDVLKATGQSEIPEDWAKQHFLTKNIGKIEDVANALNVKGGEK